MRYNKLFGTSFLAVLAVGIATMSMSTVFAEFHSPVLEWDPDLLKSQCNYLKEHMDDITHSPWVYKGLRKLCNINLDK